MKAEEIIEQVEAFGTVIDDTLPLIEMARNQVRYPRIAVQALADTWTALTQLRTDIKTVSAQYETELETMLEDLRKEHGDG